MANDAMSVGTPTSAHSATTSSFTFAGFSLDSSYFVSLRRIYRHCISGCGLRRSRRSHAFGMTNLMVTLVLPQPGVGVGDFIPSAPDVYKLDVWTWPYRDPATFALSTLNSLPGKI